MTALYVHYYFRDHDAVEGLLLASTKLCGIVGAIVVGTPDRSAGPWTFAF